MIQWVRRRFLAGLFITVPLVISVAAFIWIFRLIDGFVAPWYVEWLGREVPGLGIITTALLVLFVGVVATNVIGKRVLQRAEGYLLRVPVFRTIYAPVKQLVVAFSPDNEYGFKRVVLVEDAARGFLLGFLTKEFTVERGGIIEPMVAVYVPTPDFIREGAVVIDVGTTVLKREEDVVAIFGETGKKIDDFRAGKTVIVGDVHPAAYQKTSMYTPVPGGVGPLTIAMLLRNTVTAAQKRRQ